MLRLNPNNMEKFISENKKKFIRMIASYVPGVILDTTDSASALVNRILEAARRAGVFSETFGSSTPGKDANNTDIERFALHIMTEAGPVTVREPIFELHKRFKSDGHIETIETEVPQVNVFWKRQGDAIQAYVSFPTGEVQLAQEWEKPLF